VNFFQDGVDFTFVGEASDVVTASFDDNEDGFAFDPGKFGTAASADRVLASYESTLGNDGGALRVMLGPGFDADPRQLLGASFDTGSNGFTFRPDVFAETSNPDAVSGLEDQGSLIVTIGPGNTGAPASGGWSTSFELAEANAVTVDVTHSLSIGPGFESTEFGEAVLLIDGIRLGNDVNDSLAFLAGKAVTSTEAVTSSFTGNRVGASGLTPRSSSRTGTTPRTL